MFVGASAVSRNRHRPNGHGAAVKSDCADEFKQTIDDAKREARADPNSLDPFFNAALMVKPPITENSGDQNSRRPGIGFV
jgi:hypothetical protein